MTHSDEKRRRLETGRDNVLLFLDGLPVAPQVLAIRQFPSKLPLQGRTQTKDAFDTYLAKMAMAIDGRFAEKENFGFFCFHGIPGVGKTRILYEIAGEPGSAGWASNALRGRVKCQYVSFNGSFREVLQAPQLGPIDEAWHGKVLGLAILAHIWPEILNHRQKWAELAALGIEEIVRLAREALHCSETDFILFLVDEPQKVAEVVQRLLEAPALRAAMAGQQPSASPPFSGPLGSASHRPQAFGELSAMLSVFSSLMQNFSLRCLMTFTALHEQWLQQLTSRSGVPVHSERIGCLPPSVPLPDLGPLGPRAQVLLFDCAWHPRALLDGFLPLVHDHLEKQRGELTVSAAVQMRTKILSIAKLAYGNWEPFEELFKAALGPGLREEQRLQLVEAGLLCPAQDNREIIFPLALRVFAETKGRFASAVLKSLESSDALGPGNEKELETHLLYFLQAKRLAVGDKWMPLTQFYSSAVLPSHLTAHQVRFSGESEVIPVQSFETAWEDTVLNLQAGNIVVSNNITENGIEALAGVEVKCGAGTPRRFVELIQIKWQGKSQWKRWLEKLLARVEEVTSHVPECTTLPVLFTTVQVKSIRSSSQQNAVIFFGKGLAEFLGPLGDRELLFCKQYKYNGEQIVQCEQGEVED